MSCDGTQTSKDESEEQVFIREHPEFIVTRVRFRSDPFEVVDHLVKSGDKDNTATTRDSIHFTGDPTVEDADAAARYQVEKLGGVVEVWQRVGCYKAEAKPWC